MALMPLFNAMVRDWGNISESCFFMSPNDLLNVKLTVAYDGTCYLGWQKTQEGPSIEESLQAALEKIIQRPIALQAASRTDAGVHAEGQIVNFLLPTPCSLDMERLRYSLNSMLPSDIVILHAEFAHPDFHPSLGCTGKEYHYYVSLGPYLLPWDARYCWYYGYPLQFDAMQEGAKALVGTHNFSAFCNTSKERNYKDKIRTLQSIEIDRITSQKIRFRIQGNHFLYKMVRNIVGTLLDIGRGKIDVCAIPTILKSLDRTYAGVTAPAAGLFLHRVIYALHPAG
jgi:tRNA pseudouridine38-40 synthase